MQQIAQWLEKLGMSEYVQAFAENRIDFSVLHDLTDQDLKDVGVALGDRRKLLRAIRELDAASAAPAATLAVSASQDSAERRQLTVMFCDLVGSTALSAKLDPEDLRGIIGTYHRCCAELIERNGGFVAKYMGDGVLAYFGYPQAHEDDAERAVQAGLALVEAVPKLVTPAGSPLRVRLGIATGLVVVGDLTGSGEAQERGIVGDTPNLAARLQGIAEPDMVVIADGTRRLIGNLFELQDLGARELKGIAGPAQAWAALRASSVESRFDALRVAGPIELVGREEEFDLLLRRWSKAKSGEGQLVLLCGEAGIGKSGLTAGMLERVAAEPHVRVRSFCSPQHTDSAFYPIIGQMERAAGLARDDTPQTKLDKLDAMLAQTSTSIQDATLFAEMLSLPNDGRYPTLNFTPQQRRQKTLEALPAQIEALARANPVLMIFEDVHWIDPTSLEVLDRVINRITAHRVLVIVTFRPEFKPAWIGRAYVTAVTINRLSQRNVDAMIDQVVGNKLLPANIRQDILERADGIPLFIEEMTKAVLEAGGEGEARRTAATIPSPALAVPASLHASLMARLDRLGPAKELAQIGAAIGREFSHALLASVVRRPEAELGSALDRLIAAGLLFRQGVPPNATYLFNHALVQDAAYGTLLREPRRAIHARITETLETQFVEIADSQPELLARHATEAGLIEKAAGLWGKAGRRSLARSALIEAAEQLARALGQLASMPGTAALRREQIKLQINLSNALIHTKGHASPETKASFEKARLWIEEAEAAGDPIEDPLVLFSVLYGFWVGNRMAFKGDIACELAEQFLALAQNQSTVVPRMIGHMLMGISLVLVGDIANGRVHLDRVVAQYNPAEHRLLATRFGHDVRMTALCWRALTLWILGYPDSAAADIARALKDAQEIGHAATSMFALAHGSLAHTLRRDHAAAGTLADELVTLAQEKGSLYWKSYGLMLQAWLLTQGGQTSKAIPAAIAATDAMRSTGATAYAPWYMSYLAKAYAERGQFDNAWRCIDEALMAAETTKEKWCESDIHRIAGEIALMPPEPNSAKAQLHFDRALSVARDQQAKSFELRAATSITRLCRNQDKQQQARDLLAPVYNWFTEGFDTSDLMEAKAVLEGALSVVPPH
jgi:class 3 adenylate cyclase/predicted ATPase